jgi:hypothetical protein
VVCGEEMNSSKTKTQPTICVALVDVPNVKTKCLYKKYNKKKRPVTLDLQITERKSNLTFKNHPDMFERIRCVPR